jgi:hypothetical protein
MTEVCTITAADGWLAPWCRQKVNCCDAIGPMHSRTAAQGGRTALEDIATCGRMTESADVDVCGIVATITRPPLLSCSYTGRANRPSGRGCADLTRRASEGAVPGGTGVPKGIPEATGGVVRACRCTAPPNSSH